MSDAFATRRRSETEVAISECGIVLGECCQFTPQNVHPFNEQVKLQNKTVRLSDGL